MIGWLTAGLAMGAIGSLHCVGMCGPIAMSLPAVNQSPASRFAGTLLYNAGRVFTYALLGAILGAVGYSFVLLGFQRWLTISAGILMLIFLLLPNKFKKGDRSVKMLAPLRKKIAAMYSEPRFSSLFAIGVLNGLLPCGLVYASLAVAVAGGNIFSSSLFMAAFGAGTLPMMWMVAFFAGSFKLSFRLSIRKAYPYIVFVMACIMILRGLNLGIPFISPELHNGHSPAAVVQCHD